MERREGCDEGQGTGKEEKKGERERGIFLFKCHFYNLKLLLSELSPDKNCKPYTLMILPT